MVVSNISTKVSGQEIPIQLQPSTLNKHHLRAIDRGTDRPSVIIVSPLQLRYAFYQGFQDAKDRRHTFPISKFTIQSVILMSDGGYRYITENPDTPKGGIYCFYCKDSLGVILRVSDIWKHHAQHRPNCEFLKSKVSQDYIDSIQREYSNPAYQDNPDWNDFGVRLATFITWPLICTQNPELLAQKGLFFWGENNRDEVRCVWCQQDYCDWLKGELPHQRHFRETRNCNCKYALDQMSEAQESNPSLASSSMEYLEYYDTAQYQVRKNSFEGSDFPVEDSLIRELLVCNGYYYNQQNNQLKCYGCKSLIECSILEPSYYKEMMDIHRRYHVLCIAVIMHEGSMSQVILLEQYISKNIDSTINIYNVETKELTKGPITTLSENMKDRMMSYCGKWPLDKHQSPYDLSCAGFICANESDKCYCYSCGLTLDDWHRKDIPWIEHKKHGNENKCVLIRVLMKKEQDDKKQLKNKIKVTKYTDNIINIMNKGYSRQVVCYASARAELKGYSERGNDERIVIRIHREIIIIDHEKNNMTPNISLDDYVHEQLLQLSIDWDAP